MQKSVNDYARELEEMDGESSLAINEGGIITKEQANDLFLQYFMALERADMFKVQLEKAMEDNDITKWETDDFIVTRIKNKPSRRLDAKKVKETIEGILGESIENYYTETEVKKPFKLVITDRSKSERRGK